NCDWSSDVCSSDLAVALAVPAVDAYLPAVDPHGALVPAGLEQVRERRGGAVGVRHGHVTGPRRGPGPPGEVELQARRVRAELGAPGPHRHGDVPRQRPERTAGR